MPSDADHYEAFYAEKLWSMLPSVYRMEDAVDLDSKGPLRELCERIGVQAAVLRRSIDRLWEDQSIEACDDWVIGYLGELLATRIMPVLPPRGQRLDVAKTIHFRRRKGTIGALEEIAHDITGWDARVVEMFRRLARSRHSLDPAIGQPLGSEAPAQGLLGQRTRTPMGGFADLRDVYGASRANGTAFDETFHTADVRLGRGRTGWHNISRLGVFLWRLRSVPVEGVDPVAFKGAEEGWMTFDPTGRSAPLFARSVRSYGDDWVAPEEHALPVPITQTLLASAWNDLYASADPTKPEIVLSRSLGVLHRDSILDRQAVEIDPERGRFRLRAPMQEITVSYCQGLVSAIGAGSYDRRVEGAAPAATARLHAVDGAGGFELPSSGTLEIDTSRTYKDIGGATIDAGELLVVKAGVRRRPLFRFAPGAGGAKKQWTITGRESERGRSSLWLDGIFVSGADLVLDGVFATVKITASTLDPGSRSGGGIALAADGAPLVPGGVVVKGHVDRLVVERSITGPIRVTEGSVDEVVLLDSIVQSSPGTPALELPTGATSIDRVTLLGEGRVRRMDAKSSILHDRCEVADHQHGSVRFCAWAEGSTLPRRYASLEIAPRRALFTSLSFGEPGYGQLLGSAPAEIAEGAEDGSEMGAYSRDKSGIKERALIRKLREYMPVGLVPVLIHVT